MLKFLQRMRILFVLFILASGVIQTFSQPIRIHFMGGFANYGGDIQQKSITLKQANGVITAGATINLGNKFAIRSDYSFAHLGADDLLNNNPKTVNRNLNFRTIIKELNLMAEYTLYDLAEKKLSPYVFAGVSGFYFAPYTHTATGAKIYLGPQGTEGQGLSQYPDKQMYKKIQFALPFGGGLKYALSDDVHLGFELGFRKLFTDYLDDVSTTYADETFLLNGRGQTAVDLAFRGDELKINPQPYPAAGTQRGNIKKDYYYFGQLRIGFRMNWFDNGNRNARKVSCPAKV